jgi:perosamine synthetase
LKIDRARRVTDEEAFIPWARPHFWGEEQRYVADALTSSWISGGPYVDRLERDFAAICQVRYATSASNGTTALQMAYLALGLRPGDEVVVPGFGFLAAANVAIHMGASPVFCEVDPDTWCMRAQDVVAVLSERTRAIVAVHTYGNMCEMDSILALARERGLPVIEDAAEAFGSRYNGRHAGTLGTVGTYSFQATKTITTGEGGMVVTDDEALTQVMTLYRNHGLRRRGHYWHDVPGYNFRLTNIQAAMGCAQLEQLDAILAERRRVAARYKAHLSALPGIIQQRFPENVDAVVWAIAVRLDPKFYPQGRDQVMDQMSAANIETRPGFYPPTAMQFYDCPSLPVCEGIAATVISLPSFSTLSDFWIDRICRQLDHLRRRPG